MSRRSASALGPILGLAVLLSLPLLAPPGRVAVLPAARAGAGADGRGVHLPAVDPIVLPSGVRLFLLPDHRVPLVSVHVRLPGGTFHDAPAQAGRAALLADWVVRGAGDLDAPAFRRAVSSRGGTLSAYAAPRWIALDAEFLAEDQARGLGLVRDVLEAPRLEAAELEKARSLALEQVKALHERPAQALGTYWNAWLFGAHPWGNPAGGDLASLDALASADALRTHWREVAAPANRWIAITGDFDRETALALLAGAGEAAPRPPPTVAPAPPRAGGLLLVDAPEASQTYLRLGGRGFDRADPDHDARYLANAVLGGRFTSRLNTALRVRAGLTYGAQSFFDDERGGAFAIDTYTAPDTTRACLDLARSTYEAFVADGITAEELASVRAWVKGRFAPRVLETPAQQAAWLLDLAISGLSRDVVDGFFARLDALTLEEVNRVIAERFPREPSTGTFVGPADVVRPQLEGLGEVTEVRLADPGFGPR